ASANARIQQSTPAQHHFHDRRIEEFHVPIKPRGRTDDGHAARTGVAAPLFYVDRNQRFVLADQDPQALKWQRRQIWKVPRVQPAPGRMQWTSTALLSLKIDVNHHTAPAVVGIGSRAQAAECSLLHLGGWSGSSSRLIAGMMLRPIASTISSAGMAMKIGRAHV